MQQHTLLGIIIKIVVRVYGIKMLGVFIKTGLANGKNL
jgi:hypothetical protein